MSPSWETYEGGDPTGPPDVDGTGTDLPIDEGNGVALVAVLGVAGTTEGSGTALGDAEVGVTVLCERALCAVPCWDTVPARDSRVPNPAASWPTEFPLVRARTLFASSSQLTNSLVLRNRLLSLLVGPLASTTHTGIVLL